jgi:long-chain acyl-CoA synthetase
VEDLLHRHPDVRGAAVIGVSLDLGGGGIITKKILDPATKGQIKPEDILEWAKDKMTHYKIPSIIEFRDELPVTLVGKILRRVLKQEEIEKAKKR